jgi:hypothetical protein
VRKDADGSFVWTGLNSSPTIGNRTPAKQDLDYHWADGTPMTKRERKHEDRRRASAAGLAKVMNYIEHGDKRFDMDGNPYPLDRDGNPIHHKPGSQYEYYEDESDGESVAWGAISALPNFITANIRGFALGFGARTAWSVYKANREDR